jgi:tetratricopeptide (TPR) repeat protein
LFSPLFALSQNHVTDSLKNLLPNLPDDSSKVEVLNKISYGLFTSDYEAAIDYGMQSKELAEEINYQPGLAYALKNIGLGYYMKGDFIKVVDFWNQSLSVFESNNDLQGVANIQNNLGAYFYTQGDDAHAIELYLKSLANAEKLKDTLRIATALNNIGGVYFNKQASREKALGYFLKAVPLGDYLNDKGVIWHKFAEHWRLLFSAGKRFAGSFLSRKIENSPGRFRTRCHSTFNNRIGLCR